MSMSHQFEASMVQWSTDFNWLRYSQCSKCSVFGDYTRRLGSYKWRLSMQAVFGDNATLPDARYESLRSRDFFLHTVIIKCRMIDTLMIATGYEWFCYMLKTINHVYFYKVVYDLPWTCFFFSCLNAYPTLIPFFPAINITLINIFITTQCFWKFTWNIDNKLLLIDVYLAYLFDIDYQFCSHGVMVTTELLKCVYFSLNECISV